MKADIQIGLFGMEQLCSWWRVDLPDERSNNVLWTTSAEVIAGYSYAFYLIGENSGNGITANSGSGDYNCRCVRFEESETSEGSSGSSNSSGSSILGNSEQPVTMIGPVYIPDEFPFVSLNSEINGSRALYYFEAIRFCSQLVYEGFDDWFLPTNEQMYDYVINNNDFIIPNLIDNGDAFWLRHLNNSSTGGNSVNGLGVYVFGSNHPVLPNRLEDLLLLWILITVAFALDK